jgi:hypothetical protein
VAPRPGVEDERLQGRSTPVVSSNSATTTHSGIWYGLLMRRLLLVLFVLGVVVLAVSWRHHAKPASKAALAMAILKDVAETDGDGISWRTRGGPARVTLWQHDRSEFWGDPRGVSVKAESWDLELHLSDVFGIQCYLYGQEPDYPPWGFISFQPENRNVFNALFEVGFVNRRLDAFERLCAKHGIPVDR